MEFITAFPLKTAEQKSVWRSLPLLFSLALSLFCAPVWAADSTTSNKLFDSISEKDFKDLTREFSAAFAYTSVTGAAILGANTGLELGILAGVTKTPEMQRISKQYDANSTHDGSFASGGYLLRIGFPRGFTFEGQYAAVADKNLNYQRAGGALMWTFTDARSSRGGQSSYRSGRQSNKASAALRLSYVQSKLDANETLTDSVSKQTVLGTVSLANQQGAADFILSYAFTGKNGSFDPYLGVGYVNSSTALSVIASANATIFSKTYYVSSGGSATNTDTTTRFLVGIDTRFFRVVTFGMEYQSAFSTTTYTARLGLRF